MRRRKPRHVRVEPPSLPVLRVRLGRLPLVAHSSNPVGEARRLQEHPEQVEVWACPVCGGASLARYGAGEPRTDLDPCRPSCARPRGGAGLLRLRYARVYSAP